MIRVITISRQLGSGGAYIGTQVAQRLGMQYVDKEIIHRMAAETGLPFERLEETDESDMGPLSPRRRAPDGRRDAEILEAVIKEFARQGNVVLMGRGGTCILQNRAHTLHVRIVAPLEDRIRRLMERSSVSYEVAARAIHESDKNRAAFHRHFFAHDWSDSALYHLILNTGLIPPDKAVECILEASQQIAAERSPER